MHIAEAAHATPRQPVRFLGKVAQARAPLRRHHQDGVEIPGGGQALVQVEQVVTLQALANLALVRFQIPERVVRVDGVDVERKTELRLEHRPGPHEQFEASAQGRPGGALELGDDAFGGAGPDGGLRLGQDPAVGVAFGQLQVDMPVLGRGAQHFSDGPDPGGIGVGHRGRHALKQPRQRDALRHWLQGRRARDSRDIEAGRGRRQVRQPRPKRCQVLTVLHVPPSRLAVPARPERLGGVFHLERDRQVGVGHGPEVSLANPPGARVERRRG